jgi:hypothetical protein
VEKAEDGWIFGSYREDQLNGFCELYSKENKCLF